MNKNKIVIVVTNQLMGDTEPYFMNYLRNEVGLYVIFIVSTKQDINFYKSNFKDSFDEIYDSSLEFEYLTKKYNKDNLLKEAIEIENRLGCSLHRLFIADRTIGRGFHASGGYYHPKTRLHKNSSNIDIINLAVSKVKFWDELLKRENIYMAINLPKEGQIICINKNINSYKLYDARFEKRQFWTSNLYLQPDNIEEYFLKNKNKKNKSVEISLPPHSHMTFRKIHLEAYKLFKTIKFSFLQILKRIYGKLRGYRKGKNIYAWDEFKYIWRRRRDYLRLRRLASINKKSLKDKKYIYFPLIAEPEIALHGIAEDFFFQLSAINMISRDLPSDHVIIVKEHLLALGRRPKDFYNQIVELKNVFIGDPLDLGISYIKNSKAVACATGTAAWEAAAMGIPVISFSKNNCFNFLDHVFYVNNSDDTKNILNIICKNSWPSNKSKKDGEAFYESSIQDSFDILGKDAFVSWSKSDTKKYSDDKREKLAKILYEQLLLKIKNN